MKKPRTIRSGVSSIALIESLSYRTEIRVRRKPTICLLVSGRHFVPGLIGRHRKIAIQNLPVIFIDWKNPVASGIAMPIGAPTTCDSSINPFFMKASIVQRSRMNPAYKRRNFKNPQPGVSRTTHDYRFAYSCNSLDTR